MANILNLEDLTSKMNRKNVNAPTPVKRTVLTIPIWHKSNLTLEEAAAYSGIGINRLRDLTNRQDGLVIFVGRKRLIKRRKLDDYLDSISVI